MGLTGLLGLSLMHFMLFSEVVPLWAIRHTDMPRPALGALIAVNTVMAVLLQVPASRGADTLRGAIRLMRWGGYATALACPLLLLAGGTSGWATMGLLTAAIVLITMTELWQSSSAWYLYSEIPPPSRRGEYLAAMRMGGAAQTMIAPAALVFLALHTSYG